MVRFIIIVAELAKSFGARQLRNSWRLPILKKSVPR